MVDIPKFYDLVYMSKFLIKLIALADTIKKP